MKKETPVTKLTAAQTYAAHLKAAKRAEALDRRNPEIVADNARINEMYAGTNQPKAAKKVTAAKAKVQRTTDTERVSDNAVYGLLLVAYEAGNVITGSYSTVWGWVESELQVVAPFCHFRATQLARVGRRFEDTYSVSFEALCPDLRAAATAWVSDIG